jgi:hypothetical protein
MFYINKLNLHDIFIKLKFIVLGKKNNLEDKINKNIKIKKEYHGYIFAHEFVFY